MAVWRSLYEDVGQINEVALRPDGMVTVSGFTPGALRSTQPGHPFVGRSNEYRPKGGDTLRLGSKGRHGSCLVAGTLCDHLYNTPERFRSQIVATNLCLHYFTNNRLTI